LFERPGHQPFLSHPKETKAIAAARLKNDKSTPNAWRCSSGAICCPRCGSRRQLREARELIRHGISLVWLRTQVKNRFPNVAASFFPSYTGVVAAL
jgi:hypothetical protein